MGPAGTKYRDIATGKYYVSDGANWFEFVGVGTITDAQHGTRGASLHSDSHAAIPAHHNQSHGDADHDATVASLVTGKVPTGELGSGVADVTTFLRGDQSWATPSGGGAPTDAEYVVGAVHAGLSVERLVTNTPTVAWDLATAGQAKVAVPDNAITYAKIQDVSATDRFLGRDTIGAGDPEEITPTAATALLDLFTSALKGLVPASGGGTTNFLRADGTFAAPPGGSGASLTRISGASGAAGADLTWQILTANSADITTIALSAAVMTTTGVGVGTWRFRYTLLYQTAALTTGIAFGVNHTGTVTKLRAQWQHITTGGAAATGVGDADTIVVAGQLIEGKQDFGLNAVLGSASGGVDTINRDIIAVVEGIIVVSVSGTLELKIATEVAGSAVRITASSMLELHKIA